jgi:hypothetical protein
MTLPLTYSRSVEKKITRKKKEEEEKKVRRFWKNANYFEFFVDVLRFDLFFFVMPGFAWLRKVLMPLMRTNILRHPT